VNESVSSYNPSEDRDLARFNHEDRLKGCLAVVAGLVVLCAGVVSGRPEFGIGFGVLAGMGVYGFLRVFG